MLRLSQRQQDIGEEILGQSDPARIALLENLAMYAGADPLPVRGSAQPSTREVINPKTGLPMFMQSAPDTTQYATVDPLPEDQRGIIWDPVAPYDIPAQTTPPPGYTRQQWAAVAPISEVPTITPPAEYDVPQLQPVTIADLTGNPLYAAQKAALEQQYDRAQESIFENVPGSRYSGLIPTLQSETARDRARGMTGLYGELSRDEYARRERRRTEDVARLEDRRAQEIGRRERARAEQVARLETARGEEVTGLEQQRLQENILAEQRYQEELARREGARAEELGARQRDYAMEVARREGIMNLAAQMATQQAGLGTGGLQTAAATAGQAGGLYGQGAATQANMARTFAEERASKKGGTGELVGTIGAAALLKSPSCHTARLVFGVANPEWLRFFFWKEQIGPTWFRNFYNRHTERFANWLEDKPGLQRWVRAAMRRVMWEESYHGV
jgi:hypothetical protein